MKENKKSKSYFYNLFNVIKNKDIQKNANNIFIFSKNKGKVKKIINPNKQ